MKNLKSSIVATLAAVCFAFVAFASQPVEAMMHHAKAGISAPAKHTKSVKKAKKAKKTKKVKKAKKAKKGKKSKKIKTVRKTSSKTTQPSYGDPSAQ